MTEQGFDYTDGKWYATTLGDFVGLLVDSGPGDAVCFRVSQDSEPDASGQFTRHIELVLLPNGHVAVNLLVCQAVHKKLLALLKSGVVK
jgi:hypothetical protein